MFKINTLSLKFIKVNLIFFKFNLTVIKKSIIVNMSLNNKLVKYKRFNIKKKNKNVFIDKILNYFIYFFFKKSFKFNLLIFEVCGLNYKIKKDFKLLISKYLKNINFKRGFLIFIEKTLISFNGSKKSKKRRKKLLKKKRNIFFKKTKLNGIIILETINFGEFEIDSFTLCILSNFFLFSFCVYKFYIWYNKKKKSKNQCLKK